MTSKLEQDNKVVSFPHIEHVSQLISHHTGLDLLPYPTSAYQTTENFNQIMVLPSKQQRLLLQFEMTELDKWPSHQLKPPRWRKASFVRGKLPIYDAADRLGIRSWFLKFNRSLTHAYVISGSDLLDRASERNGQQERYNSHYHLNRGRFIEFDWSDRRVVFNRRLDTVLQTCFGHPEDNLSAKATDAKKVANYQDWFNLIQDKFSRG